MKKQVIIGLFSTIVLVFCIAAIGTAQETIIVGEVNDEYQVVSSEGKIYEVADTEKGNELVNDHIGEKVKVTGTINVMEEESENVIIVTGFTVIPNE